MVDGWEKRLLQIFWDDQESLFWNVYPDEVRWFAMCNDVFVWGSADCELITEADMPVLEQAVADVYAVLPDSNEHAATLYCARQRQMRPQGAVYPIIPRQLWPLFDACGPERATGLGNPYPRPADPA